MANIMKADWARAKQWLAVWLLVALAPGFARAASAPAFKDQNWFCWHREVQDGLEAASGNVTQIVACARAALATPAPFGGGELLDFRGVPACVATQLFDEVLQKGDVRILNSVVLHAAQTGPAAADLIPIFRKHAELGGQSPILTIPMRVALANMGHRPSALLHAIAEDINTRGKLGDESTQNYVLRCLAAAGVQGWMDNMLARQIVGLGEASGNTGLFALLALGTAGTNSSAALPFLEKLEEKARTGKADSGLRRVLGFTRYRIDPERPKDILRANISFWGARTDPSDGAVMMWIIYTLMDDEMRERVIGLLADPDDRVRYGAASVVAYIGRPAAKAVPGLIALVREAQVPQVRMICSLALGTTAAKTDVPELQKLLAQEKEEAVKKILANSLHMIKHELLAP